MKQSREKVYCFNLFFVINRRRRDMLQKMMSTSQEKNHKKVALNDRELWMPISTDFVEETCREGCQTDHYQQYQNMRGLLLYACANSTKVKRSMFLCEVVLGEPQVVRNAFLLNNHNLSFILLEYTYIKISTHSAIHENNDNNKQNLTKWTNLF